MGSVLLSYQDIQLAKQLFALTPSSQPSSDIANEHGVDIILGGHDHLYFVGRGVDEWDNYNLSGHVLGAEEDEGDVLVIKSGTDFRDISEICLELTDTPKGSARKKLISRVTGERMLHRTRVEGFCTSHLSRKASPD
jgi:5'-nucleotidase